MTVYDITPTAPQFRAASPSRKARVLLTVGAFAGPVFYLSACAQMLAREGFDLRVHPISQLSTGEWGWIQMLTFVLAGVGLGCLAVGHRMVVVSGLGRGSIPLFVAIAGLGFVAAGIFPQDASHGFPAGTLAGPAAETTWHAAAHMAAAVVGFTALAVAAVISLVRAIRGRRPLAAVGNAVVALVLLVPVAPDIASIQVAITGLFAFGWCTVVAFRLRSSR